MLTNSKVVRNVLVISVSSTILILSTLFYLDYTRTLLISPKTKQQVNTEVKSLFEALPLNATKTEILNIVHRKTEGKNFHINDNNGFVQVISPHDYSFTWSWTILIFFDENNNSVGIAIRPIDGSNYWFCKAPADKGIIPKEYITSGKCIQ